MEVVDYLVDLPPLAREKAINNIRSDKGDPFTTSNPTKKLEIAISYERCLISRFDFSMDCHKIENYGTELVDIIFLNVKLNGDEQEIYRKHCTFKASSVFGQSSDLKKVTIPIEVQRCLQQDSKKQSNRVKITLFSKIEKHLGINYFLLYKEGGIKEKRYYLQPGQPQQFRIKDEQKKELRTERRKDNTAKKTISVEDSFGKDWSVEQYKRVQTRPKEVSLWKTSNNDLIDDDFIEEIGSPVEKKYKLEWDERKQAILDDASPQWIELQRKYEIDAQVPYEYRITSKIQQKPFASTDKVLILVESHFWQMRLASYALRLGLDSVYVVEDDVLIVAEAEFIPQEDRQLLPGVNYVKSSYIIDCLAQWEKLNVIPYLLPMKPDHS